MDDKTTGPVGKGIARRRLLRGTFAAPAVLTLVSGSSLAAGSSSCVANQSQTQPLGIDPSDTWVRVPLYEIEQNQNVFVRFVSGTDIDGLLPLTGISSVPTGFFQCVQKVTNNSNQYTNFSVGSNYSFGVGSTPPTPMNPLKYVAIRVDASGTVLGGELIDGTNLGSAMSFVCWSSFGGKNPFGKQ